MVQKNWLIVAVAVIVSLGIGWWLGSYSGYKKGDDAGYKRAEADIKKIQDESAKKATEAAAKAANPFQTVNPLESVESNPFEKAKKVLNPFK